VTPFCQIRRSTWRHWIASATDGAHGWLPRLRLFVLTKMNWGF
jgi:hypothetical protein